jgi:GDP-L-fucose synthase
LSGLHFSDKIYVAGHTGLVGSAIVETLGSKGYENLVLRTYEQLDLRQQTAVDDFFMRERPNVVFLAAAKVGGIHANNVFRADFILENLLIQNSVIWAAYRHNVRRLVFLGSSCIYPKNCHQPMKEEYLLTGELEYTNRPYALAKIAGLELVNAMRQQYGCDWFSVMPTNLYGPRDCYHPENSHVLPSLIRRFEQARITNAPEVTVWGTGSPRREFMFSLDCAAAIVLLAETENLQSLFQRHFEGKLSHINIGVGSDLSIAELAELVADVVGFRGRILFDREKPDGTQRKKQDISILSELGFESRVSLRDGVAIALADFRKTVDP